MNDLKKLKVGVIGLGFMGELHANVYSTLSNVELVGIADKDSEKKELAKKYNTKYYENYKDLPRVVVVGKPNELIYQSD